MNRVKQWILIDPLDTLFFKGSEPMIAGESHEVRSIFPPMPSTFVGAFRTAILQQRRINPKDFTSPEGPDPEISKKYPLLGTPENSEFEVIGPIFRLLLREREEDYFIPAPAHWFGDLPGIWEDGQDIYVAIGEMIPEKFISLGLCGGIPYPVWVLEPERREVKSLAGYWVNLSALTTSEKKRAIRAYTSVENIRPDTPSILSLTALFDFEGRVGIALENLTRRARQGHLYSSTHVRLKQEVSIVIGLSDELVPTYLNDKGVLQLGGEQRVVRYELLSEGPLLRDGGTSWIMGVAAFSASELETNNWQSLPRVSGPLIRMGGWDMKSQFHKPIKAYYPAGTVIMAGQDVDIPYNFIRL